MTDAAEFAAAHAARPGDRATQTVQAGVLVPIAIALGSLLAPLTCFIGRAREVAEVRELLQTTRLLTLTGPGGPQ